MMPKDKKVQVSMSRVFVTTTVVTGFVDTLNFLFPINTEQERSTDGRFSTKTKQTKQIVNRPPRAHGSDTRVLRDKILTYRNYSLPVSECCLFQCANRAVSVSSSWNIEFHSNNSNKNKRKNTTK